MTGPAVGVCELDRTDRPEGRASRRNKVLAFEPTASFSWQQAGAHRRPTAGLEQVGNPTLTSTAFWIRGMGHYTDCTSAPQKGEESSQKGQESSLKGQESSLLWHLQGSCQAHRSDLATARQCPAKRPGQLQGGCQAARQVPGSQKWYGRLQGSAQPLSSAAASPFSTT